MKVFSFSLSKIKPFTKLVRTKISLPSFLNKKDKGERMKGLGRAGSLWVLERDSNTKILRVEMPEVADMTTSKEQREG